jgi:hypothetical protein
MTYPLHRRVRINALRLLNLANANRLVEFNATGLPGQPNRVLVYYRVACEPRIRFYSILECSQQLSEHMARISTAKTRASGLSVH